MRPMRSALAVFILVATCAAPAWSDEPAPKPNHYATLLARECDDLIAAAIKRPYGWGWSDTDATEETKKSPAPGRIAVSLEPATTPTAALILLHASELLHQPKYAQAARNVARGVAAAQQPSGKFPSQALYGTTAASAKEPLTPLPDRASTRASLALLLSLIDDPSKEQEVISRAAARGALWLLRQQAEPGGWPILYPPDAETKDATRIVRLDTPDTRDTLLAMLLAYEVLGDPFQRRSAERSVEFLLKVRSGANLEIGAGLWQSAYTLSGMPPDKSLGFPAGYDTLASRYSMQAIFAVWVILGDGQRLIATDLAAKSIDDLIKREDGKWRRRFDARGATLDPPAPEKPLPNAEDTAPSNDPALLPALATIALAKDLGRDKFREALTTQAPLKRHLAQVISGLSEDVLDPDFPTAPDQVPDYLKRHEPLFRLIESGPASDLSDRTRRLWAIYLRATIEARFGN
jgi:hypothetical protein